MYSFATVLVGIYTLVSTQGGDYQPLCLSTNQDKVCFHHFKKGLFSEAPSESCHVAHSREAGTKAQAAGVTFCSVSHICWTVCTGTSLHVNQYNSPILSL